MPKVTLRMPHTPLPSPTPGQITLKLGKKCFDHLEIILTENSAIEGENLAGYNRSTLGTGWSNFLERFFSLIKSQFRQQGFPLSFII